MSHLTLYSRPDCHLCDKATSLLAVAVPAIEVVYVDIEPDLALVSRYGVRVPVLQRSDNGAELDWPFDESALMRFLLDGQSFEPGVEGLQP